MSIICVVTTQIQFLDTLNPISRVGAVVVQLKLLHRILAFLKSLQKEVWWSSELKW
jgi:hypothetical protein